MKLAYLICVLLLAASGFAEDSSGTAYRLVVDNKALRSIHDLDVYRIPKGTSKVILDFSKVLASPFFKTTRQGETSGITSAIVEIGGGQLYHTRVGTGSETVVLGPDTLHDVFDRKSFRSFGGASFTIRLGKFLKGHENGEPTIDIETYWSCNVVIDGAPNH